MANEHLDGWRQWIRTGVRNMAEPAASSFTAATASDFQPIIFRGDRTPNDPTDLLEGLPLVKIIAIKQRALDLHGSIPSFEDVHALALDKIRHQTRIAELTKHQSEGGFGLDASAPQVISERRKLERVENELARLTELREVRTTRWQAAARLDQTIADWLMHGGIPANCVIETIEDQPVAELLKKGETLNDGVLRFRHRLRELDADAHRVNSSPWPSSEQKRKATDFINQLAERGRPNFESMIEQNSAFSVPTIMLTSLVRGIETPALAFADDVPDALGILCWVLRDQLLAMSNSELDEIADDKVAMDQKQRDIALAQTNSDRLAAEKSEVSLIWAAEARGDVIDFRSDTTPCAAIGVALKNVPRAAPPSTSPQHAYDIMRPGGR
jgi:hypothetical protein